MSAERGRDWLNEPPSLSLASRGSFHDDSRDLEMTRFADVHRERPRPVNEPPSLSLASRGSFHDDSRDLDETSPAWDWRLSERGTDRLQISALGGTRPIHRRPWQCRPAGIVGPRQSRSRATAGGQHLTPSHDAATRQSRRRGSATGKIVSACRSEEKNPRDCIFFLAACIRYVSFLTIDKFDSSAQ